jgi:hypothetical protein
MPTSAAPIAHGHAPSRRKHDRHRQRRRTSTQEPTSPLHESIFALAPNAQLASRQTRQEKRTLSIEDSAAPRRSTAQQCTIARTTGGRDRCHRRSAAQQCTLAKKSNPRRRGSTARRSDPCRTRIPAPPKGRSYQSNKVEGGASASEHPPRGALPDQLGLAQSSTLDRNNQRPGAPRCAG